MNVSRLALGSWRTFERIPFDDGVAVMEEARRLGITFLDDARYDDETGAAPIPTGWSEVLFGRLFRAAGWERDAVVIANKLWWEHWPGESGVAEVEGSLERMELDRLDLVYAAPPPEDMTVDACLDEVAAVLGTGRVGAWGTLNWPPDQLAAAARRAAAHGIPGPVLTQLPYSILHRHVVEDPAMVEVLDAAGIGVVASAVLAGGILAGGARSSRIAGRLDDPRLAPSLAAADDLAERAARLGTTPAALAIAFALGNERVTSVLFGATSPEQVRANVAALGVHWDDT